MSYWRFIVFWTLFSLITGIVVLKAKENPLQGITPRYILPVVLIIITYFLGPDLYSIQIYNLCILFYKYATTTKLKIIFFTNV